MNSAQETSSSSTTSVLLFGAITFANIDYVSIMDYSIKAFVGGLFWLGFKLTADWISRRIKNKRGNHKTDDL